MDMAGYRADFLCLEVFACATVCSDKIRARGASVMGNVARAGRLDLHLEPVDLDNLPKYCAKVGDCTIKPSKVSWLVGLQLTTKRLSSPWSRPRA